MSIVEAMDQAYRGFYQGANKLFIAASFLCPFYGQFDCPRGASRQYI
jgi:hypothetical protein